MASKATGSQVITFVEDGYDYGPDGESYFEVWRGTRAQALAKASALRLAGFRVQRRKWSGPGYQVTGTISLAPVAGGGSGSETPVDRWRITTQLAQLDMRSNPKLLAAFRAFVAEEYIESQLNINIQTADNLLASGGSVNDVGPSSPPNPAADALGRKLFNLRARGTQSYELKRPVLTRIRTVSTNYANQFIMEAQPKVYTTAALIRDFGLPATIQQRLPATPNEAPSDTVWAWLWQQQDSDTIPSLGRVEEMDSWVFAAWSTVLYDVVA